SMTLKERKAAQKKGKKAPEKPTELPKALQPELAKPSESVVDLEPQADWTDAWGATAVKKTKKGKKDSLAAEPVAVPEPEPEFEAEKPSDDWSTWMTTTADKKKGKDAKDPWAPAAPEVTDTWGTSTFGTYWNKDKKSDAVDATVMKPVSIDEPKVEEEDDWFGFGRNDKSKKKDKKDRNAPVEVVDETPVAPVMQPEAIAEDKPEEDAWTGFGTLKNSKKSKKKGTSAIWDPITPAPTLSDDMPTAEEPAPEPKAIEAAPDDMWGSFGAKKSKTSKKGVVGSDLSKTVSKDSQAGLEKTMSKDSKTAADDLLDLLDGPLPEEPKKEENAASAVKGFWSSWGAGSGTPSSTTSKPKEKPKSAKELIAERKAKEKEEKEKKAQKEKERKEQEEREAIEREEAEKAAQEAEVAAEKERKISDL
ncbi:hypothetical protein LTS18_014963, partial [Coniosporium uncinatum]